MEGIERKESDLEKNIKNCTNSLDYLVHDINEGFCKSIEDNRKRKERLKEKYYNKICGIFCCLKSKYKDNEDIINEINDIKDENKNLNNHFESLTETYMSQKEKNIDINLYSCISKRSLLILFLSFFHFYAIAEINGYLYSLFGELKRTVNIFFNPTPNTDKTFDTFFTKSTITDSSQINFNYFTSIFASYFICKFSIMTLYAFSTISLLGIICLVSFFNYLDKEHLNSNYKLSDFITLMIYYILIYFFAGLVALLPYELLKVNKVINSWDLLLMHFLLTLAVIFKNILHDKIDFFKSPKKCTISYILSASIFFIYLLNIWIQNNSKEKNKNNNQDESSNQEEKIRTDKKEDNKDINNNCKKLNNELNISLINNINDNDIDSNEDENDNELVRMNSFDYDKLFVQIDNNEEKEKDNNEEKEDSKIKKFFTPFYILGCLIIKFPHFMITIKIKSLTSYICSILRDKKIMLILLINLLSRTQKLKFKTIYKKEYNSSIYYLIGNFSLSYLILFIFSIYFFIFEVRKEKKIANKKLLEIKECYINNTIIIDNFIVFIFSVINLVVPNPIFSYLSISISGNFNFLLYEYYSTIEREYISISGFISFAQIIFRIFEFIFEPCPDYWLYIQIVLSILGIFASYLYYRLCIISEKVKEKGENYIEEGKSLLNVKFYVLFFIPIIIISVFIFWILSHYN